MCLIAKAIMQENTFFIYRDNGVEVSFHIDGLSITSSIKLTQGEYDHIRKYYMYESKINHQN
jgi:hypothetical protein